MKAFFVFIAFLVAATLSLIGCKAKIIRGPDDLRDWPQVPAGIHVATEIDTLHLQQGDSIFVRGHVTIGDGAGYAKRRVRVELSLLRHFGYLAYENWALRDTTNDSGRVDFRFCAANQFTPAFNIIRAYCWYANDSDDKDTIWVIPTAPLIARLNVSVPRDIIYVSPVDEDSMVVTVSITDSTGVGVPNIRLVLLTNGGRLGQMPRTDSSGVTVAWWWTNHEPPGHYYFTVHAGAIADTAWVLIMHAPNPGP